MHTVTPPFTVLLVPAVHAMHVPSRPPFTISTRWVLAHHSEAHAMRTARRSERENSAGPLAAPRKQLRGACSTLQRPTQWRATGRYTHGERHVTAVRHPGFADSVKGSQSRDARAWR